MSQIRIEPEPAALMKQLARSHRATSFHGYLAALQALLFRLLPTETTNKLVIGIAEANRVDSQFSGSIGNFLNILPLLFDAVPMTRRSGKPSRRRVKRCMAPSSIRPYHSTYC